VPPPAAPVPTVMTSAPWTCSWASSPAVGSTARPGVAPPSPFCRQGTHALHKFFTVLCMRLMHEWGCKIRGVDACMPCSTWSTIYCRRGPRYN
jgi:hypothetical protein